MIANNIISMRKILGMSQYDLADIMNLSQSSIAKWEKGINVPSGKNLVRLAEALKCNVNDITGENVNSEAHETEDITFSNPIFSKDITGECKDLTLVDHSIHIPQEIADKHKNGFALQVVSDCMSKVLPQGAVIIVDRSIEASNDSIVVAQKEDKTVLLRRYSCGTSTVLLSADSYSLYDDVVCKKDDMRIIGVVVWAQPPKEFC